MNEWIAFEVQKNWFKKKYFHIKIWPANTVFPSKSSQSFKVKAVKHFMYCKLFDTIQMFVSQVIFNAEGICWALIWKDWEDSDGQTEGKRESYEE